MLDILWVKSFQTSCISMLLCCFVKSYDAFKVKNLFYCTILLCPQKWLINTSSECCWKKMCLSSPLTFISEYLQKYSTYKKSIQNVTIAGSHVNLFEEKNVECFFFFFFLHIHLAR